MCLYSECLKCNEKKTLLTFGTFWIVSNKDLGSTHNEEKTDKSRKTVI